MERELTFRLPTAEDKELLQDYVREHAEHGEYELHAVWGLNEEPFDEWLAKIHKSSEGGFPESGEAQLLMCLDEGELVGMVSVRYELPEELSMSIGDVGYGVRPDCRRKGYATRMLRKALDICREHGKERVIIGCYKDNEASNRTIQKCGGVFILESDNYEKGRMSCYYEILI